jgi:hypothetical protein
VTALIAGLFGLRTEGRRRRQEREDARLTDVRLTAADVFTEMFVLQHEIEWITWHARFHPEAVNAEMLAAYDAAVHSCIPRLLGSLAVLTSRDRTLYDRVFRSRMSCSRSTGGWRGSPPTCAGRATQGRGSTTWRPSSCTPRSCGRNSP